MALTCGASVLLHAQDGVTVFRSAADLVLVPVTVTDRSGRFVRNLSPSGFELFVDGQPTPITQFSAGRAPVSIAIVLDVSGSMSREPRRWELTRRSVASFLSRLETGDEVTVVAFNDRPQPMGGWTHHTMDVFSALGRARTGGRTALFRALAAAIPPFANAAHSRKVLLLISDGNDNDVENREIGSARAVEAVRESGVALYAIGIGMGREPVNRWRLGDLAEPTGGYVEVVRDERTLEAAVARVAGELHAQYILGFERTQRDARFHDIAVKTRSDDHRIRARAGYFAMP